MPTPTTPPAAPVQPTAASAIRRGVDGARTRRWRAGSLVLAALLVAGAGALLAPTAATAATALGRHGLGKTPPARAAHLPSLLDSLLGRSRKLRARFLAPTATATAGHPDAPAALQAVLGDSASAFRFLTLRPFTDKVGGRIGGYRIGFFPGERRTMTKGAYANPAGFLEVTAATQDVAVSEHFRLRDFLTHDQQQVWPKYLVLREALVDKLELVIAELRRTGVAVDRLRVMSGFRTPQYNAQGVGAGGRVQDSRHQYGDAADVYVVNGGRDWMSDLDGDGRITVRDAKVIAAAAERVERAHPELVGGVGIYQATDAHGPFVHIDVRGTRARWGVL